MRCLRLDVGIDEVNIGVINGANDSEGIVGVGVDCDSDVGVVQGRDDGDSDSDAISDGDSDIGEDSCFGGVACDNGIGKEDID